MYIKLGVYIGRSIYVKENKKHIFPNQMKKIMKYSYPHRYRVELLISNQMNIVHQIKSVAHRL